MAAKVFPDGAKFGLEMILQALPFQCSTRVSCILELSFSPTAQILLAAIAAMPPSDPTILGLDTPVPVDALLCSISNDLPLPLPYAPTAQALCRDLAAAP